MRDNNNVIIIYLSEDDLLNTSKLFRVFSYRFNVNIHDWYDFKEFLKSKKTKIDIYCIIKNYECVKDKFNELDKICSDIDNVDVIELEYKDNYIF